MAGTKQKKYIQQFYFLCVRLFTSSKKTTEGNKEQAT